MKPVDTNRCMCGNAYDDIYGLKVCHNCKSMSIIRKEDISSLIKSATEVIDALITERDITIEQIQNAELRTSDYSVINNVISNRNEIKYLFECKSKCIPEQYSESRDAISKTAYRLIMAIKECKHHYQIP